MAGSESFWSADVPVSMPVPSKDQGHVPMFGFVFTGGGLAHDITEADYDRLSTPDFSPDEKNPLVYDDLDVDQPFASEETF